MPRREPARGLRALTLACALMLTVPVAATPSPAPQPTPLAEIAEATVTRWQLPGLAVGLIEDGQVTRVVTRGETVAGSGQPVTPHTLFRIASNSKAMTTALLARLVQQGRLDWDDPVTKYLPEFRMHDDWVTRHLRVADLLTHASGLPEGGGDLLLWPAPNAYTRQDVIHALRFIRPAYAFRTRYEYDNLLYVVAGEVAAAAGGASYETLLQREVFTPLGLERCRIGDWQHARGADVAAAHRPGHGRNIAIDADATSVHAATADAAGGVWCDLDSMLRWARQWLAPDAAELAWLDPAQRRILQSAHMLIPVSARRRAWDHSHVMAYGYGWRMADVDGQWLVWHTGTLSGMYSMLALLPDRRSGFVFLINGEAEDARTVLSEVLVKRFTDPADRRGIVGWAAALAAERDAGGPRPQVPDTRTSVPADAAALAGWLGTWRDPWLGEATLCAEAGGVRFRVAKSPRLTGTLRRLGSRHFIAWDDAGVDPDAWADFHPGTAGGPAMLHLAKLDPDADFSADFEDLAFRRVAACPTHHAH